MPYASGADETDPAPYALVATARTARCRHRVTVMARLSRCGDG
ncbi:hypothetical protein [Streptomyces zagrosensis]|uniref:Uncharacterized protein n=1 Tax=Streptomyces zagrosensis TaxID=1042984 RepID=A0A7W9QDQ5_9ACTN|nr:hypothetical protein [Streptomyces zagrosensis]MBB5937117.1 hypothetical protein [Streptomyces zagrosensis]